MFSLMTSAYILLAFFSTLEIVRAQHPNVDIPYILFIQVIIFLVFVLCNTAWMAYKQKQLKKEQALSDVLDNSIKTYSLMGLLIRNIFVGLLLALFFGILFGANILLLIFLITDEEKMGSDHQSLITITKFGFIIILFMISWFENLSMRIVYGKNNIYNQKEILKKSDTSSILSDEITAPKKASFFKNVGGTLKNFILFALLIFSVNIISRQLRPYMDDSTLRIISAIIIIILVAKLGLYIWYVYQGFSENKTYQSGFDPIPPALSRSIALQAHIGAIFIFALTAILTFLTSYVILQIFYFILPDNIQDSFLFFWFFIGIVFVAILIGIETIGKAMIDQLLLLISSRMPEDHLEYVLEKSSYEKIKATVDKIPDDIPLPLAKRFFVGLGHHIVGNYEKADELAKAGASEAWQSIKGDLEMRSVNHIIFDNYLMLLAENALVQGKYEQAFDIIKRALKINRNNLLAYNTLFEWYYVNGEMDKLQGVIERMEQLSVKKELPLNYHLFKAVAYAYQQDEKNARQSLQEGKKKVAAPVQEAIYQVNKGRVEIALGNPVEARQALEEALRLFPNGAIANYVAFDMSKLPS